MKFGVIVALFFAMSLGSTCAAADGGPAQLVKDILPGQVPADSDASEFVEMNGVSYYQGYHPSTGYELWRTDGTQAGTWIVKDVLEGRDGSDPVNLEFSNGYLYFMARAETNSYRLWRTDGTESGTEELLKGSGYSRVTNFYISSTGRLYLEATTPDYKHVLVSSDGSAAGSVVLMDLASNISIAVSFLGDVGSLTLFTAVGSTSNVPLWRTDGTAAGTVAVPVPASVTQVGSHGVELNGQLYFFASSGLWKTDGTAEGTALVAPPYIRLNGRNDPLAKVGNVLFFTATNNTSHQLWKSDGTAEGTAMVNENQTGRDPYHFTVSNGLLYYIAEKSASYPGSGSPEVWRSDGTADGTFPLTNFNTPGDTQPTELTAVGDKLYFRSWDNGDLYVSDGTVAGTRLVKEFNAEVSESYDFWPTAALGTSAIFTAEGGTGRDLWISNGTAEGTRLVYEPQDALDSGIAGLISVGDKWFFHADDGEHGREPWVSDGTPAGTFMLKDVMPGQQHSMREYASFAALNGKVYFSADNGSQGIELWESDGTEAGTRLLKDIEPGAGWSNPSGLASSNGKLFFSASTSASGREMWVSDGTEGGTRMIVQLFPFTHQSPNTMAAMNGEVYFTCAEYDNASSYTPISQSFYKSDGTADGTVLLTHLEEGGFDSSPGQQIAELNGLLLFPWKSRDNGIELWKTDGTPGGTAEIKSFGPYGMPQYLTTLGNYAYFRAIDDAFQLKLWRTDGTVAGTTIASAMDIGSYSDFNELVAKGDKLYFSIGWGPDTGLWSYNPANGIIYQLHHLPAQSPEVASEWLLYSANDGTHGAELWKSNGLPGQATLVQDIFSVGSSEPEQFTAGAGTVLFTAETAETGRELWSIELNDLSPAAATGWELYE